MKKVNLILFTILSVILIQGTGCNQTGKSSGSESAGAKTGLAAIDFKTLEHDFGQITEGEKVAFLFSFDNSGTGDLVIESATTSCGCTVPEFEDKPIPPGGSGTLEVVFDSSGRSGMQTKTITVRSNAAKPVMILKITAEVISSNN
jgi:hypothetical protein